MLRLQPNRFWGCFPEHHHYLALYLRSSVEFYCWNVITGWNNALHLFLYSFRRTLAAATDAPSCPTGCAFSLHASGCWSPWKIADNIEDKCDAFFLDAELALLVLQKPHALLQFGWDGYPPVGIPQQKKNWRPPFSGPSMITWWMRESSFFVFGLS